MREQWDRSLEWARRHPRLLATLVTAGIVALALVGAVAARGPVFFVSCDPAGLAERPLGRTSFVHGSDGSLLVTISSGEQWRPVPLRRISPWLRRATIAIEDHRFYDHDGVDYRGLVRALAANIEAREAAQGGSTITQQLARTLYLGREKSFRRKLDEACIAVELEREWTKEQILGTYLNRVRYGHRAHGSDAAARTYFSKRAADLTLPEAALLAGLPQAPSMLDPMSQPDAARERRDQVLVAMAEVGDITEQQLAQARRAPLGLQPSPAFGRQRDEYLAIYVQDLLVEHYGEAVVRRGGLRVRTTIDPRLQEAAREAIADTLDRADDPAAALVAIEPETGALRTMVAVVPGRESVDFNFAADGRRQAGSTFKSFALAEAVRRGIDPWTTEFLSAPFTGPDSEGEPWEVATYDGTYHGRVTLADATARSDNTVYARLIVDLGPARVLETAAAMGIRSELPAVPSIVLGSGDLSVLEMAAGYSTLANEGRPVEPRLIERVTFPDGQTEQGPGWEEGQPERALPPAAAYHVTRVLQRVIESGTGTAAAIGRPAAGKTGTTDDYTDAWFAGYTPQLVAAVWIGHPDRAEPMRDVHGNSVSGGTFPAAIWQLFMVSAHEDLPAVDFAPPAQSIEWRRFCGRVQFARTMAEERPRGCPEPRLEAGEQSDADTSEGEPAPEPPPTTAPPPPPPPAPGPPPERLVGTRGFVAVPIPPDDGMPPPELGEVEVQGELWPARSEDGGEIPEGVEIEVVAAEDGHLIVRPAPEGPGDGG